MLTVHVTAGKVEDGSRIDLRIQGTYEAVDTEPTANEIENASIDPDGNGNVDDSLDIPLHAAPYNYISVRACTNSNKSGISDCADLTPQRAQVTIINPLLVTGGAA
jgi:hypothetical protein